MRGGRKAGLAVVTGLVVSLAAACGGGASGGAADGGDATAGAGGQVDGAAAAGGAAGAGAGGVAGAGGAGAESGAGTSAGGAGGASSPPDTLGRVTVAVLEAVPGERRYSAYGVVDVQGAGYDSTCEAAPCACRLTQGVPCWVEDCSPLAVGAPAGVGDLTVTSLRTGTGVPVPFVGAAYQVDTAGFAALGFAPGERFTVDVVTGPFTGMGASLPFVGPREVERVPATVRRAEPFVVTFTPSPGSFRLDLTQFGEEGGARSLFCAFPATTGRAEVPAAALQGFRAGQARLATFLQTYDDVRQGTALVRFSLVNAIGYSSDELPVE